MEIYEACILLFVGRSSLKKPISCSLYFVKNSNNVHHKNGQEEISVPSLTQSSSSVVREADIISEGPGFESWLGHHFSMVLSSLSDSWHYPCSVENVQEMAAPSEMCWANEELESPVGKKQSAARCG